MLAALGYHGRALAREQAGAYAEAIAEYTAALEFDPSDDRAFTGRCRVEAAMGNYPQPGCSTASIRGITR